MKTWHLLNKFLLRIRSDGIGQTLREVVFLKRVMVAIEKVIAPGESMLNSSYKSIIITPDNINEYLDRYPIQNIAYHCRHGAQGLLLVDKENNCLGYQIWTFDNRFIDLRRLSITLKEHEAYMFDLFVYPKYRGTVIPKIIATETFNHLASCGVKKTYGFFFLDNTKALWWHRANLKCTEIKRVNISRFFFLEFTNGKFRLNI